MTATASPLSWPTGWKRTAWDKRAQAKFSRHDKPLTIFEGISRIKAELVRMAVHREDIIISTNLKLRLNGDPYSDQAQPADPGVAVYWREIGHELQRTMAVDRYTKVQDNMAAIAATLDAMRAIERHGGAAILERAFAGFLALPAPGGSANTRTWREVLSAPANHVSEGALKALYRFAVSAADPNKAGGSSAAQAEVNVAYAQAKQELGYA